MENFGSNVVFQPQQFYQPRTEAEVLEILARHPGQRIKVVGRLHSWSEAANGDQVVLDLRHLNQVEIEQRTAGPFARAGAGCQIKKLLIDLEAAGLTTPTLGLITEQAIAGAISTGTHGSGRHSISHYIDEIRIATYDTSGRPRIRTITDGPELRAARCSLGMLGVILSVGFHPRPLYHLEEWIDRADSLKQVLEWEADTPLQQFYLVPWSWNYFVHRRRETHLARSRLASIYSLYSFLAFDVGLHLGILALERLFHFPAAIRGFFRYLLPATVIRRWKVVDQSQRLLIMEHELFRHIEIEMFVRKSVLEESMDFTQQLLRHLTGEEHALSEKSREQLQSCNLLQSVEQKRGVFVFNYLVTIRKVLADDTLISMASDDAEPWYALSFISYAHPRNRDGFFAFARCLSECLVALFGARPHWGKYCPLTSAQVAQLYPHRDQFRDLCRESDPSGVFLNDWLAGLFELPIATGDVQS